MKKWCANKVCAAITTPSTSTEGAGVDAPVFSNDHEDTVSDKAQSDEVSSIDDNPPVGVSKEIKN